jgi:hypothetical protein
MLIRLLVDRGQNEPAISLAGERYIFKRNEFGHLVTDISDPSTIKWVTSPLNKSFEEYVVPVKDVSTEEPKSVTVEPDKVEDVPEVPPVIPEGENYAPTPGRFDGVKLETVTHTTPGLFQCPECKKVFGSEQKMKGHLGSHKRGK